jgi:hypothetical protein
VRTQIEPHIHRDANEGSLLTWYPLLLMGTVSVPRELLRTLHSRQDTIITPSHCSIFASLQCGCWLIMNLKTINNPSSTSSTSMDVKTLATHMEFGPSAAITKSARKVRPSLVSTTASALSLRSTATTPTTVQ